MKRFIYHSAELYAGKTKIRIPLGAYQKDKSIFCEFLDDNFHLIKNQEEYLLNIKPTTFETIKQAKTIIKEENFLKTKPISQNKKRKIIPDQKWFVFNKEKKEKVKTLKIEPNKLIYSTKNKKHQLILKLLFEMNLSPREIINLKVKDIYITEQLLRIRKFKQIEKKVFLLPGHLLETLRKFTENKEPNDLLLKSARDKRYSRRTIEKIRENAFNKANLAPESDDN